MTQTTDLKPSEPFENQAFDLAVSFYKIFDIDPYKWAALCGGQVNLIQNALKAAYAKGLHDVKN